MRGDKLFDRWRRRYRRWLKRQDVLVRRCRRRGDAEEVHELRVIVRRLRLMVRLAAPFVGREVAEVYRDWSRSVSDITSELRDLDVVLEWLQPRSEATALTQQVLARRRGRSTQSRSRLRPMTGGLSRRLLEFRTDAKARKRFTRRYRDRFARLFERSRPLARRYARMPIEERHAFRRRLRQLRYLRELALPRRKHAHDPVLQLLVRPQLAMGELQNLQLAESVLKQRSRRVLPPSITRRLSAEQARWDREIRLGLKALADQRLELEV